MLDVVRFVVSEQSIRSVFATEHRDPDVVGRLCVQTARKRLDPNAITLTLI